MTKKYSNIMETAKSLFWKHGFKRVTIEEICKKAGVSKMTFYRYFRDKLKLAIAVYDKVVEEGVEKFREILRDDSSSSLQKMEKILMLKMQGTHDISQEFLVDFYTISEPGLSSHVEKKTRESWDEIIKDFKEAQEKGLFRKDFNPEALFLIAGKLTELMTNETMLGLYANPQEMIMEFARFYTFGIMPR